MGYLSKNMGFVNFSVVWRPCICRRRRIQYSAPRHWSITTPKYEDDDCIKLIQEKICSCSPCFFFQSALTLSAPFFSIWNIIRILFIVCVQVRFHSISVWWMDGNSSNKISIWIDAEIHFQLPTTKLRLCCKSAPLSLL